MKNRKPPFVSYSSFSRPLIQRLLARGGHIPKPTKPKFSSRLSAFFGKLFS